MIREVSGDILLTKAEMTAQGVAPNHAGQKADEGL